MLLKAKAISPIQSMRQTFNFSKMPCFILSITFASTTATAQNLSAIYQLALEHNPLLKQAEANQLAIGESKNQSIAQFLPTVALTAASSRNRLTNKKVTFQGVGVQDYWNHNFNINLTQPLFHWEHWVQLSQSDNKIAQAEAAYQAELQNLMLKTTEAYFNILSAEDNLQFASAEKEAIARQLEQAKQRFEVGLIAITDVHEAQAGFDQALANEIEASNNLDNQKEALREIIGETEAILDPITEKLPLIKPEPADISAWSENAEISNLGIISAFNQAEIARKSIDLQRSNHLPTLDIVASYGETDNNSTFGLRGTTESVGLQLNVPLFQGGAVNSRTRQASYEFTAAKESLNAKKREIRRQVKNAFRGITSNMSRVEALESSVKSAQSALEATEAGFEIGTRTMVDVLNEQRNLYRAKRDYSRTRYDYLINSLKLKHAASSLTADDMAQVNKLLVSREKK
jgi:outer membrane protein